MNAISPFFSCLLFYFLLETILQSLWVFGIFGGTIVSPIFGNSQK